MTRTEESELERRVARLERELEALKARHASEAGPRVRPRTGARPVGEERPDRPAAGPPYAPPRSAAESTHEHVPRESPLAWASERWLGIVGIAFVVLSFGFLLKLSFDRGWVTPPIRVGAGFLAGGVSLWLGLTLEGRGRALAQALLGGGVALWYLSAYGGSQLYGLIPMWLAFSMMATTAVVALVLSERQASPVLAILGVAGGLAVPFLLPLTSPSPGAGAVYSSLVLLGAAPVYVHRGWPALLVALAAGGTLVVGTLARGAASTPVAPMLWLIGVFWTITVVAPLVRPRFRHAGPSNEPVLLRLVVGFATAVVALAIARYFDLDRAGLGWVVLLLGAAPAALAFWNRRHPDSAGPAGDVAAVTIAVGLALVTWSSFGQVLVMVEVAVLLVLAARGGSPSLVVIAHGLSAAVAVAFLLDCQYSGLDGPLGLREGALSRVAVLGLAVAASLWADDVAPAYLGGAYVGLLVLFLSELGPRPQGQALVSIAWALQGTAALLGSFSRESRFLQGAGLATLTLVALKLLFVDLVGLDPVWRILLFLGFGVTLVGLGYLMNRKSDTVEGPSARGRSTD